MISNLIAHNLSSIGAINRASELCDFAASLKDGDLALCSELCVGGYERLGDEFEQDLERNLISSLKSGAYLGFSRIFNDYNEFILLSSKGVEFKQNKYRLFKPNNEDKITLSGSLDGIKIHNINGVKIGVLICFELRFIKLWDRLMGASIILVPAMWGKARKAHYKVLCQALALQNRAYVIACSDMDLRFKSIFAPDGKRSENMKFDINLIDKFKKSLGIDDG
ncbi:carbon-nitrogen hydrolase family protein [Campylobacter porcelli]|uniref:Hydrolase, carbon-nitrogen family n=1 Tax=Campylobacter porcelli TaxID=1660073 RepID=A0A1X9SYU2_9BACT|nr:carbon-nitrogen hydrolase family protein [Campylobacter sp. RM6137]ARR01410.1 hydrolase, carbon-nitrogen family [Campylobacter sp. RM6137]